MHRFEHDLAERFAERTRRRWSCDGGFLLHELVQTIERGGATLHEIHHPTHRNHWPAEHPHIHVEHQERSDRDLAGQQTAPTDEQHDQESHADQRLEHRHEQAAGEAEPQILADVIAVEMLEAIDFSLFLRIGADYPDTREILLHAAADIGKQRLNPLEALMDYAAELDHGEAHERGG